MTKNTSRPIKNLTLYKNILFIGLLVLLFSSNSIYASNLTVNTSNNKGIIGNNLYGVNINFFLVPGFKIDVNGDNNTETNANTSWHEQRLNSTRINNLRVDMNLENMFNYINNNNFDSWQNDSRRMQQGTGFLDPTNVPYFWSSGFGSTAVNGTITRTNNSVSGYAVNITVTNGTSTLFIFQDLPFNFPIGLINFTVYGASTSSNTGVFSIIRLNDSSTVCSNAQVLSSSYTLLNCSVNHVHNAAGGYRVQMSRQTSGNTLWDEPKIQFNGEELIQISNNSLNLSYLVQDSYNKNNSVVLIAGYMPSIYSDVNKSCISSVSRCPPTNYSGFGRLVYLLINNITNNGLYNNTISVEVWNEPDTSNFFMPDKSNRSSSEIINEYVSILNGTRNYIKSFFPLMPVGGIVVSNINTADGENFTNNVCGNISNNIDFCSLHTYNSGIDDYDIVMQDRFGKMRNISIARGCNCTNILLSEFNQFGTQYNVNSTSFMGRQFASAYEWVINNNATHFKPLIYSWSRTNNYSVGGQDYPQRYQIVSEPQLENLETLTYNTTKKISNNHPPFDIINSIESSNRSSIIGISTKNNSVQKLTIINKINISNTAIVNGLSPLSLLRATDSPNNYIISENNIFSVSLLGYEVRTFTVENTNSYSSINFTQNYNGSYNSSGGQVYQNWSIPQYDLQINATLEIGYNNQKNNYSIPPQCINYNNTFLRTLVDNHHDYSYVYCYDSTWYLLGQIGNPGSCVSSACNGNSAGNPNNAIDRLYSTTVVWCDSSAAWKSGSSCGDAINYADSGMYWNVTNLTKNSFYLKNIINNSNISSFCLSIVNNAYNTSQCTNNTIININGLDTGNYSLNYYSVGFGDGINSIYFNVTQNISIVNKTNTFYNATYQAIIKVRAYQLFTNNSISQFNVTNNLFTNATTFNNETYVYANNGSNNIMVLPSGNYSKNNTCVVSQPFTTNTCNVTGVYDNLFTIYVTDGGGFPLSDWSLNVTNSTLGGVLYNISSSSNTSIVLALLQGYYYNFSVLKQNYTKDYSVLMANNSINNHTFSLSTSNMFFFTFYNETTNNIINNTIIYVSIISDIYNINKSTNNGSLSFELPIYSNYTIQYYIDPLVQRNYYAPIVANTNLNISLYIIDSDISNYYTPKVIDEKLTSISGAEIRLLRYYILSNNSGVYNVVEMSRTDDNGNAILRVVPNTINYKLIISKNGRVLETTPTKFYSSSDTYTLPLISSVFESLNLIGGVYHSLTFNNVTNTFVFTWVDTGALINNGCLNIKKTYRGVTTTINNVCNTGTSGSIIYTITDINQTSYLAKGILTTNTEFSTYYEQLEIIYNNTINIFNKIGVLLAFLIMLILIILSTQISAEMVLITTLISISTISYLGFINITWTVIVYLTTIILYGVLKAHR